MLLSSLSLLQLSPPSLLDTADGSRLLSGSSWNLSAQGSRQLSAATCLHSAAGS